MAFPAYLRWVVPTLSILLGLSLLLHFWTFYTLYRTRSVVKEQISLLATQVETASDEVARFDVPIKRAIPVHATIPVQKTLTVPISTTFAFSDSVSIPLLGTSIDVPVQMDVPINTQVPFTINESLDISTTVDLDLSVPVEVAINETPLAPYLDQLHDSLLELNEAL